MALGGVASVVFGALLVASPGRRADLARVAGRGLGRSCSGVSSLGLAYRLHEIDAALPKPAQGAAAH